VGEADLELQLKTWKELAVRKQIQIKAATDALGLDSECSSDELKVAVHTITRRGNDAEAVVNKAKQESTEAISAMEIKLAATERARAEFEAAKDAALIALQEAEQRMAVERAANTKELKKLSARLAEKQDALKAINTALADTPENVVKKLKALKREKFEEGNARKKAEGITRELRKDKQQLEKRAKETHAALEQGAKLVEQYRDLRKVGDSQRQRLQELVADGEELAAIPDVDEELLEAIEKAARGEEE
jgi:hypothetical protein